MMSPDEGAPRARTWRGWHGRGGIKNKKPAATCHSSLAPELGHAPCVRCLGRLGRLLPHMLELRGRRLGRLALVPVMQASYSHVSTALWALDVVLEGASVGSHSLRCGLVHLGYQRGHPFPSGTPEKESHKSSPFTSPRRDPHAFEASLLLPA